MCFSNNFLLLEKTDRDIYNTLTGNHLVLHEPMLASGHQAVSQTLLHIPQAYEYLQELHP